MPLCENILLFSPFFLFLSSPSFNNINLSLCGKGDCGHPSHSLNIRYGSTASTFRITLYQLPWLGNYGHPDYLDPKWWNILYISQTTRSSYYPLLGALWKEVHPDYLGPNYLDPSTIELFEDFVARAS